MHTNSNLTHYKLFHSRDFGLSQSLARIVGILFELQKTTVESSGEIPLLTGRGAKKKKKKETYSKYQKLTLRNIFIYFFFLVGNSVACRLFGWIKSRAPTIVSLHTFYKRSTVKFQYKNVSGPETNSQCAAISCCALHGRRPCTFFFLYFMFLYTFFFLLLF